MWFQMMQIQLVFFLMALEGEVLNSIASKKEQLVWSFLIVFGKNISFNGLFKIWHLKNT